MTPELFAMDKAKQIAEGLHKHYPGHLWQVAPSADFSTLTIKNIRLSDKAGICIHIAGPHAMAPDAAHKTAMRMGGELLERFRVSRAVAAGLEQARQVYGDRKKVFESPHDA